jgi:UDP-GlcNAc3NAcA epimerase
MRILSVIGARPQFIKAGPVSAALRREHEEILVHTGQHYDYNMSDIFFTELDLPKPDVNLEVGSGSHAVQTAGIMMSLEKCVEEYKPDAVLVYGDTNSTIAAALVAAKMHIPIAHVEAGLRSYNRTMPEEINRVLTDQVSDLLFCPSQVSVDNLAKEGIREGVIVVGDVMVDAVMQNVQKARERSEIHRTLGLDREQPYAVLTIHRPANTDNPESLAKIVSSFEALDMPVIFPIHPRTRKALGALDVNLPQTLRLIEPLGYLDMLCLVEAAAVAITDSGGLQKEAYILKTPAVTIRPETEWVETVESGWNTLVDPEPQMILAAVRAAISTKLTQHPDYYGDGHAAEHIVRALETYLVGEPEHVK